MICAECWEESVLDAYREGEPLASPLCWACAVRAARQLAARTVTRFKCPDLPAAVRATTRALSETRDLVGLLGELAFARRYRDAGAVMELDKQGDMGWDFNVGGTLFDVKASSVGHVNLLMPHDAHSQRVGLRSDVYVIVRLKEWEPVWPERCWCRREVIEATEVWEPPRMNLKMPTRVVEEARLGTLAELDALLAARRHPGDAALTAAGCAAFRRERAWW